MCHAIKNAEKFSQAQHFDEEELACDYGQICNMQHVNSRRNITCNIQLTVKDVEDFGTCLTCVSSVFLLQFDAIKQNYVFENLLLLSSAAWYDI